MGINPLIINKLSAVCQVSHVLRTHVKEREKRTRKTHSRPFTKNAHEMYEYGE